MQVALLGNPNTGKTSLFNALTGSYEYVGNWSGVTVEKKVGILRNGKGKLIDLPGVYSLNPISKDETVVSRFLLSDTFEEMLNIVDASQLKRNLQLTLQLLEYGKPMTIGLNMTDVATRRGIVIDEKLLAKKLQVPVVPIIARKGAGVASLEEQLYRSEEKTVPEAVHIDYGKTMEDAIEKLAAKLPDLPHRKRWLAINYLEENPVVQSYVEQHADRGMLAGIVEQLKNQLKKEQTTIQHNIYQAREQYIDEVLTGCLKANGKEERPFSERVDRIVTHRILGIPIFIGLMYLMFMLTFNWLGFPLSDALEGFFSETLTGWLEVFFETVNASGFIQALVLDGIVAGVGGVLVFVPQIFILFLFISLLEDSGYMARVATVMDRLMQSIGLNGKAFIPMIIGFGCNVPGVMAARTVEQPKERLLTILLTPLMSCSARLPVYALFVGAFFAQQQAVIVLSLYILGVVLAMILAKIFSVTVLKKEESYFIIELPPYRFPQWKTLWRSTWEKGRGFLRKAGTFIFAGSVFIWFLSYTGPGGFDVEMNESFLAKIGGVFAPLLEPLGFGTWQAGAALLTGFLAKEVVVATMAIIYAVPEASMQTVLSDAFTPVAAYSFMVFILLYIPCLATVAVIRKESGSKKMTLLSMGYALVIAYILSLIVYQVGSRLF
ncbi:ferrous iron transport protein B [Evansella caseinilytica]|uniref:Ferrous iron transport protein B n=1 Tax=Evansella caseinilytica TaxID=1503961 RepID=A0A1H3TQP6_9BACI|nr:ferrous iron transport protein B [Evansella caseinilytica]SDZ51975.1 ferrous iron transport protein B [Evansella caseinilytica]